MATTLTYAIKFVADMDKAVAFHRDELGLTLKFQTPEWSEFLTGPTTLALHAASEQNPAGTAQLGFGVDDIEAFHQAMSASGVVFTQAPIALHGVKLGRFLDVDGAEGSVSGL